MEKVVIEYLNEEIKKYPCENNVRRIILEELLKLEEYKLKGKEIRYEKGN